MLLQLLQVGSAICCLEILFQSVEDEVGSISLTMAEQPSIRLRRKIDEDQCWDLKDELQAERYPIAGGGHRDSKIDPFTNR